MSTAEILKSMKSAPKLEKATYNRWSTHLFDVLCMFDVESHVLNVIPELSEKKVSGENHAVRKQDQYIRIAISQLVPDIAFHLVGSIFSAKECWENLREFYCPNPKEDLDDLLQEFWGLDVEDDIDVDEFVQKLSGIRSRIYVIDSRSQPSDSNVKKRVLSHFMKCCDGFYMSLAIPLKDPAITLQSAVTSIRSSQEVYRQLHTTPTVALASNGNSSQNSTHTQKDKVCAHCKGSKHVRESCFLWLDTPDGSKWAAKNPGKAAKTRELQKRLSKRKNKKGKKNANKDDDQSGLWVIEDRILTSEGCHKDNDISEVVTWKVRKRIRVKFK